MSAVCASCHNVDPEADAFHLNRHIYGSVCDRRGGNSIASLLQSESTDVVVGRLFRFFCNTFIGFRRYR